MAHSILIAEDETFISKLYKFELEQEDHVDVDTVVNGKEAMEAITKKKYDLLLLDLLMPEMDGYSVLDEFQKKGIKIPKVIILSNLSQEIDRKKCANLGAVDFLVKSDTGAGDLWEKVKKHIS